MCLIKYIHIIINTLVSFLVFSFKQVLEWANFCRTTLCTSCDCVCPVYIFTELCSVCSVVPSFCCFSLYQYSLSIYLFPEICDQCVARCDWMCLWQTLKHCSNWFDCSRYLCLLSPLFPKCVCSNLISPTLTKFNFKLTQSWRELWTFSIDSDD